MENLTHAPCVLVVEDEGLVRMLAVDMFEEAGFHVIESTSGERALELLKTNDKIAGLFTDIELSGPMDGIALAHVVHDEHPDTAIIVVSGQRSPLPENLPVRSRFIAKPYDLEEVLRVLNELVDAK